MWTRLATGKDNEITLKNIYLTWFPCWLVVGTNSLVLKHTIPYDIIMGV